MDFEWDEAKRLRNIAEHGVDFRLAALIFDGPVIEAEDHREVYGEQRLRALGEVAGGVLRRRLHLARRAPTDHLSLEGR